MSNYKPIGDYIQLVDERNKDLKIVLLLGLTINKLFIPSVANIVGTNMANYKIIRKNQFACSTMQVRRDGKMPVALLQDFEEAIISQAYPVFEVKDEQELLPEYLMMWFSRAEFDREACFYAVGGVRGSLEWEDFCNMKFPLPSPEKQKEIVTEYNVIKNRIALNNQLIQKLEETAQAVYKQWFVDFEFPDEDGNPYKSSGGKMVWNEELNKEIPEGWEVGEIGDLFTLQRGHDLPTQDRISGGYPIFASTGIAEFHNEYKIDKPTIITGRSGSLGELFYHDQPCWPLNTTLYIKEFSRATPFYSLYFLQTVNLKELGAGSAVPTLNRNDIHALPKEFPDERLMELFDEKISIIHSYKKNNDFQIQKLEEFKNVLLSKLATIEN
jgi:type I restriction enzyme, S subunit